MTGLERWTLRRREATTWSIAVRSGSTREYTRCKVAVQRLVSGGCIPVIAKGPDFRNDKRLACRPAGWRQARRLSLRRFATQKPECTRVRRVGKELALPAIGEPAASCFAHDPSSDLNGAEIVATLCSSLRARRL